MSDIEVKVFSRIIPSKRSGSIVAAYVATAPPKLLPIKNKDAPSFFNSSLTYVTIALASYLSTFSEGNPSSKVLSE